MALAEVEFRTALDNCDKALFYLNAALVDLNQAYGWGIADVLGGALFISLAKKKKMDNANNNLLLAKNNINRLLRFFNTKATITNIDFMPGGFLTTTDFLFDNPVTDILVQEKIRNAKASVQQNIAKLETIKEKLLDMMYGEN